jgi:hypothetical protein
MNTQDSINLRDISAEDLEALGLGQLAYVRPGAIDGHAVWAVFAANGRQVAVLPTHAAAWAAVRQSDLELVTLH